MTDGMALSRNDNERTIALWTIALRAYKGKSLDLIPPGPRSRESVRIIYFFIVISQMLARFLE